MEIKVNNRTLEVAPGTTVADIVGRDVAGVAVAVNGKIVRKDDREAAFAEEGDDIIIIKAAYGG